MTAEDYRILLWVLGDRVIALNLLVAALLAAWYAAIVAVKGLRRLAEFIDYKLDIEFWNNLLSD